MRRNGVDVGGEALSRSRVLLVNREARLMTVGVAPSGAKELEAKGYATIKPLTNLSDLSTEITDSGRKALAVIDKLTAANEE